MSLASNSYTSAWFEIQQGESFRSARRVAPLLLEMFSPGSVLDVGCGTGTWIAEFQRLGVSEALGVDGDYVSPDVLQIEKRHFVEHDLQQPLYLNRSFDLVLSLEVAEHLPESAADDFVRSLVRHGNLVVFSAAIPRQGGNHHVNEQWPDYWKAKFAAVDFACIDCIRHRIWDDKEIGISYRQNVMAFAGKNSPHRMVPSLAAAAFPLNIVHPEMFIHHLVARDDAFKELTLRKALQVMKRLPRLARESLRFRLGI